MPHALVTQLRFTRGEFLRGLDGLTPDDAVRRFGAINPIAWMVGHLAWHEQILWLERAQGKTVAPAVKECRFGGPPSTPALGDMLAAWRVGLRLPLAAMPMPPWMAAPRSVMMSPNMLVVTITS